MSENIKVVKKILNIIETDFDYFFNFVENNIKDKIKDRCNTDTIPERLNSLIQEFLIEQYNLNKEGIGKAQKQVVSASDNGQTVTFESIGGSNNVSKNVDEFLDRNMKTLIAYRKMRR